MMIICSSVKIITAHTQTLPKTYLSWFSLHITTHIKETNLNMPCSTCIIIHTHILTITYMPTHNNTQIYTYTHKKSFWFFLISPIFFFLCLMIVIRWHETSGHSVSSHTEALWYDSLSEDDSIYAPYPGIKHSGEGINGCHPCNAMLF